MLNNFTDWYAQKLAAYNDSASSRLRTIRQVAQPMQCS
jgi:hypothetical protein